MNAAAGEWPPRESINRITWGDFVELSVPFGVSIHDTQKPIGDKPAKYLLRISGDQTWWMPLPESYNPDARMGVWVFENACRRLGLATDFTGWPLIM